ncbi:MAG: hypothetical protein WBN85_11615 [Candidatus Macondimonas sp.]
MVTTVPFRRVTVLVLLAASAMICLLPGNTYTVLPVEGLKSIPQPWVPVLPTSKGAAMAVVGMVAAKTKSAAPAIKK